MKLITRFELASRSIGTDPCLAGVIDYLIRSGHQAELHTLYRETFNALCSCRPHSVEQRTCLASLKNLEDEIRSRAP